MVPPWWGAIGGCAALFGGVGQWRRIGKKQLDNQLDCWWKAKGGTSEQPVTITNRDKSQPPLALGNDKWKVEENKHIVVVCRRDCYCRGEGQDHTTAREGGGATYPERTEEREGKNNNIATNK